MGDILTFIIVLAAMVVLLVLGFSGISLLMRRSSKKTGEKLEPIAAALGGEIIGHGLLTPYLRLRVDQFEARVEFAQRENLGSSLVLRLMTTLPFNLEVTQEDPVNLEAFLGNTAGKFLKNLASNYEFQVGDQDFDGNYFLVSKNPEQAKEFLRSAQKREIVDYFFKNGFTRLVAGRDSVYAEKPGYVPDDLVPWTVRYHLGQLNNFVSP